MRFFTQALKAVYATAIAFLGSVATVLVDNASIGDLTDSQWAVAVLAGLIAGGGVYGLRNASS